MRISIICSPWNKTLAYLVCGDNYVHLVIFLKNIHRKINKSCMVHETINQNKIPLILHDSASKFDCNSSTAFLLWYRKEIEERKTEKTVLKKDRFFFKSDLI